MMRIHDRDIEAVLFDLGGTLDAAGIAWKERLYRLHCAEGLAFAPERFASLFYQVDDALVGAVSPELSLRDTVWRLVSTLGDALHVDATRSDRIALEFYESARAYARDHERLLAQLAGRYRLGVVSNFYGNLGAVCRELGLARYLTVMVDSTVVGWTKPDPRIFRHALEHLEVPARAAIFVGDSPSRDMVGARDSGMAHVWLTGDGPRTAAPCCPDDPVIRSLDELRGLLL